MHIKCWLSSHRLTKFWWCCCTSPYSSTTTCSRPASVSQTPPPENSGSSWYLKGNRSSICWNCPSGWSHSSAPSSSTSALPSPVSPSLAALATPFSAAPDAVFPPLPVTLFGPSWCGCPSLPEDETVLNRSCWPCCWSRSQFCRRCSWRTWQHRSLTRNLGPYPREVLFEGSWRYLLSALTWSPLLGWWPLPWYRSIPSHPSPSSKLSACRCWQFQSKWLKSWCWTCWWSHQWSP